MSQPRLRFLLPALCAACLISLPALADEYDEMRFALDKARKLAMAGEDKAARQVLEHEFELADAQAGAGTAAAQRIRLTVLTQLGNVDLAAGRNESAEQEFMRAATLFKDQPRPEGASEGQAWQTLQWAYFNDAKYREASNAGSRALVALKQEPRTEAQRLRVMAINAVSFERSNQLESAKATYENVVAAMDEMPVRDAEFLKTFYRNYAALMRKLQQPARAAELEAKSTEAGTAPTAKALPAQPADGKPSADSAPPGFADFDQCKPAYPKEARQLDLEGEVAVGFDVDEDGTLIHTSIVRSSGWTTLDHATESTLRKCEFQPGTRHGKPARASFVAVYQWKLED